jgi:hypothetical protein
MLNTCGFKFYREDLLLNKQYILRTQKDKMLNNALDISLPLIGLLNTRGFISNKPLRERHLKDILDKVYISFFVAKDLFFVRENPEIIQDGRMQEPGVLFPGPCVFEYFLLFNELAKVSCRTFRAILAQGHANFKKVTCCYVITTITGTCGIKLTTKRTSESEPTVNILHFKVRNGFFFKY